MGRNRNREATLPMMARVSKEVNANGKIYRLSPMGVGELAELEAWARALPYDRLADKLKRVGDYLNDEERKAMIAVADKESSDHEAISNAMGSMAGIKRSLFLCFRVNHHDMTEEDLDVILDAVPVTTLRDQMEEMMFVGNDVEGEPKNH